MLTAQEVFNMSVGHVLAQGRPAIQGTSHNASCLYTTNTGLHCGAWPFLKPHKSSDLGGTWKTVRREFSKFIRDDVPISLDDLIIELQNAHDYSARDVKALGGDFLPLYKQRVRMLALIKGLKTTIIPDDLI